MFKRNLDGQWQVNVWRVAVLYLTMVALTSLSIFYSYNTNRESDQKHCSVVVTFNDVFAEAEKRQPLGPLAQQLYDNYKQLEHDLNCKRPEVNK